MSGIAKRRRLSPQDRRARIMDAAMDVFAAQGYDGASMREIARAAGITTPVLYDHFASKAELYATLLAAHGETFLAYWAQPTESTDADELFHHTIDALFAWIEQHEAAWRMIFLDAPSDPVVAEAHRQKQTQATGALAALFHQIPELHLSAELDRDRADRFFAEAAKWAVNAIAAWWWSNRDLSREQVVRLTSDLLWRGLQHTTESP